MTALITTVATALIGVAAIGILATAPMGIPEVAASGPDILEVTVDAHVGGYLNVLADDEGRVVAGVGPRVVAFSPSAHLSVESASAPLPGDVTAIVAGDRVAYAGFGIPFQSGDSNGLAIFDLSSPTPMTLLGSMPLPGVPIGLALSGSTLHVLVQLTAPQETGGGVYRGGRILSLDVSEPQSLRLVDQLQIAEYPTALGTVGDQLLIVASPNSDVGTLHHHAMLIGLDASRTGQLTRIESLELGLTWGNGVDSIAVGNGHAYVALGKEPGIAVVDIGDLANMRVVAMIEGSSTNVALAGTTLFDAQLSQVFVVDVSDPATPQVLGDVPGLDARNMLMLDGNLIAIENRYLDTLEVGARSTLTEFQLDTDPLILHPQSHWTSLVNVTSVSQYGDDTYATVAIGRGVVVDLDSPYPPDVEWTTRWVPPDSWSIAPTQSAIGPTFVAMNVSGWRSGTQLLVASTVGTAPRVGHRLAIEGAVKAIAASGNLLLATVQGVFSPPPVYLEPAVRIYDATDAAAPQEVGAVKLANEAFGLVVTESTAYAVTSTYLNVIDLGQPVQPRVVATVTAGAGNPDGGHFGDIIAAAGNRLAIAGADAVTLFDIQVRDTPREVLRWPVKAKLIAMSAKHLFVVPTVPTHSRELLVYSLDDAIKPPGRALMPSSIYALAVNNDRAVLATANSGVYVMSVQDSPRLQRIWLPASFVSAHGVVSPDRLN